MHLTLKEFLERNRIAVEEWDASKCVWDDLTTIARDHLANEKHLGSAGEFLANAVQRIAKVHSVRWRVKDVEHLLAKIVRKKAEGVEKYDGINVDNYLDIVHDVIGVRALHLYKGDCIEIDRQLQKEFSIVEGPIAYVRTGDSDTVSKGYDDTGFEVREHPAGYRSVHYVISTRPLAKKIHAEVQVRTIFEEGWSEIDHQVRYPNFSDDPTIAYFLDIFNRLAGNADEMGGFVRNLADNLTSMREEVAAANQERQESLKKIDTLLAELSKLREKDKASNSALSALKREVASLKAESNLKMWSGLATYLTNLSAEKAPDGAIINASTLGPYFRVDGSPTSDFPSSTPGTPSLTVGLPKDLVPPKSGKK